MSLNAVVGTLMVPTFWYLLQNFYEKYLANLFAKVIPSKSKK